VHPTGIELVLAGLSAVSGAGIFSLWAWLSIRDWMAARKAVPRRL
jgi:hypothetical protein